MSIATEIERLKSAKANIKTAIEAKGVTVGDGTLDTYSAKIDEIPSGVDISEYFDENIEFDYKEDTGCWTKLVKKLPTLTFNGTNCSSMLRAFKGNELDLSNFDTSNVNTMDYMFASCNSLTTLDISNFDTSKVTRMEDMFSQCKSLTSLDLSSFDTSSVTDMNSMFYGCSLLTSLNLSSFKISKVRNMSGMFSYSSLVTLDLSSFGETNATFMNYMFQSCSSLETLNLSNLTNLQTVSVEQMFQNCIKLNNLNMSSFDFTNTTSYTNMFQGVSNNCYILVKDETQKNWFTTYQSRMTNVHYVGEEG